MDFKTYAMQLKDKHIFILGLMKFDSEIESTNYTIARQLAKNNHVYYIDNPYTWKDCVSQIRSKGFNRRKDYFLFKKDEIPDPKSPNLKVVITPPLMSINWIPEGKVYRTMLKLNERIIISRINQIIRKYNIKSYIYINSFNFYYPGIARLLSPELVVYQCVDPLVFAFEKKHGIKSEEVIVKESDLVICTSKQLCEEKRKLNRNTFFIPNAADITHSSKALQTDLPMHESLKSIPRPIVGYFGNIERRMDYDLLKKVIEENKDKSFVFAGPVLAKFVPQWIFEKKNVHFIGPVAYQEMPHVLKGFDVCVIPFKKDEVSANIFPLKLFEYLGAGKPVVATDFNLDLRDYTGTSVSYCKDSSSFTSAINTAISAIDDQSRQDRLSIASQNTWERRVDEFAALINRHIDLKGNLVCPSETFVQSHEGINSGSGENIVTVK